MIRKAFISFLPAGRRDMAAALAVLLCQVSASVAEDSPVAMITLPEAVALALKQHPDLEPFDADLRLADARIITALTIPNPSLGTDVEDVFGNGDFSATRSGQYTVGFSQIFQLGRKRRLAGEIAEAERTAAVLRYEALRLEILRETALRYVGALLAQDLERTAEADLGIAEEAARTVRELQEGGRGTEINVGQADLDEKRTRLALQNARRDVIVAHRQLAAMWAEPAPEFTRVAGRLEAPADGLPTQAELEQTLERHPRMELARAGEEVAERELVLQRRRVVPDLTAGVAYRRFDAGNDYAMVMDFSLPLPIWNRNPGGIAEAEAGIDRTGAVIRQTRANLEVALSEALVRLTVAAENLRFCRDEFLVGAERHNERVAQGYRLGRITYFEVLEARRALTAARRQEVEILADYQSARIDIETLTGRFP